MSKKKIALSIAIPLLLFAVAILVIGRVFFPDNVAETSIDGGPKRLVTRVYEKSPKEVKMNAKEVIKGLSTWGGAWKLTDETDGGSELRLKAEVPVVVFTDDFEVIIRETEDGKTAVDARSQSRVGKSDFGENARHVRKFLVAMDEKMKQR